MGPRIREDNGVGAKCQGGGGREGMGPRIREDNGDGGGGYVGGTVKVSGGYGGREGMGGFS